MKEREMPTTAEKQSKNDMIIFFMILSIKGKDQFLVVGFKCLSSNRILHPVPKTLTPTLIKPQRPLNYKQAVEIAKEWDRPLLLVFTDQHCHWSHKLLDETLRDNKVRKSLEHFIFFEVKWQRNQYLCLKYNIVQYPSYKIVDAGGEKEAVLRHGSGYRNTDDFLAWLTADFRAD